MGRASLSPLRSPEKGKKPEVGPLRLSDVLPIRESSLYESPPAPLSSRSGKSRDGRLKPSNTEEKLPRFDISAGINLSPRGFTSAQKLRKTPLKMQNRDIQTFLERFNKPKTAAKLIFKPQSPKETDRQSTTPKNKLSLKLLLKRKQTTSRVSTAALQSSLSARKIEGISSRMNRAKSYSRMLEAAA
mmetsp:Transcript_1536/g.3278  ORF Transcript_1536/g.3278 Transcript_1536/m.3278 type:complete len:187 (-) Transcript_1536:1149-1709(-)